MLHWPTLGYVITTMIMIIVMIKHIFSDDTGQNVRQRQLSVALVAEQSLPVAHPSLILRCAVIVIIVIIIIIIKFIIMVRGS